MFYIFRVGLVEWDCLKPNYSYIKYVHYVINTFCELAEEVIEIKITFEADICDDENFLNDLETKVRFFLVFFVNLSAGT